MNNKKLQQLTQVAKQLKTSFSFKQLPPKETKQGASSNSPAELSGTDLFSCFTADIMKEKVLFTR